MFGGTVASANAGTNDPTTTVDSGGWQAAYATSALVWVDVKMVGGGQGAFTVEAAPLDACGEPVGAWQPIGQDIYFPALQVTSFGPAIITGVPAGTFQVGILVRLSSGAEKLLILDQGVFGN